MSSDGVKAGAKKRGGEKGSKKAARAGGRPKSGRVKGKNRCALMFFNIQFTY
jgi:hypothetical protein